MSWVMVFAKLNQTDPCTPLLETMVIFSKKDAVGIHPHNDDPMVITVKWEDCEIKRALINQRSSTNILYW